MTCAHYQDSLQRIRALKSPSYEPLTSRGMPSRCIFVFDFHSLDSVHESTLNTLGCALYRNSVVVPEFVLDCFDDEDKRRRKEHKMQVILDADGASLFVDKTAQGQEGRSGPSDAVLATGVAVRISKHLKVFLQTNQHVVLHRVDQCLSAEELSSYTVLQQQRYQRRPGGVETEMFKEALLMQCALYFMKENPKRNVYVVSSSPSIQALAKELGVRVCTHDELCTLGSPSL